MVPLPPKTACEGAEKRVQDHFADVGKMVKIGSSSTRRRIDDMALTRYACYLLTQQCAARNIPFDITNQQQ